MSKPLLAALTVAAFLMGLAGTVALLAPALAGDGYTFDNAASDAATDGQANGAKTKAELCRSACERDYAICGEEGDAARDTLNGRSSDQNNKVYCDSHLTECLNDCRGL